MSDERASTVSESQAAEDGTSLHRSQVRQRKARHMELQKAQEVKQPPGSAIRFHEGLLDWERVTVGNK